MSIDEIKKIGELEKHIKKIRGLLWGLFFMCLMPIFIVVGGPIFTLIGLAVFGIGLFVVIFNTLVDG